MVMGYIVRYLVHKYMIIILNMATSELPHPWWTTIRLKEFHILGAHDKFENTLSKLVDRSPHQPHIQLILTQIFQFICI